MLRRVRVRGRPLSLDLDGQELVAVHGADASKVKRALSLFESWSGREAGAVEVRAVPRGTPSVLVQLGELTGIVYRSDKRDGRSRDYIHETSRPRPTLCATPDGRRLVILGGAVHVRPEGLVG